MVKGIVRVVLALAFVALATALLTGGLDLVAIAGAGI